MIRGALNFEEDWIVIRRTNLGLEIVVVELASRVSWNECLYNLPTNTSLGKRQQLGELATLSFNHRK